MVPTPHLQYVLCMLYVQLILCWMVLLRRFCHRRCVNGNIISFEISNDFFSLLFLLLLFSAAVEIHFESRICGTQFEWISLILSFSNGHIRVQSGHVIRIIMETERNQFSIFVHCSATIFSRDKSLFVVLWCELWYLLDSLHSWDPMRHATNTHARRAYLSEYVKQWKTKK